MKYITNKVKGFINKQRLKKEEKLRKKIETEKLMRVIGINTERVL
jgi:hypothetical protein